MSAFSKEDLLASLSMFSDGEPLLAAETIGSVMSLADLEAQCQNLSMDDSKDRGGGWQGVRPSGGSRLSRSLTSDKITQVSPQSRPTRAATSVKRPHQRLVVQVEGKASANWGIA